MVEEKIMGKVQVSVVVPAYNEEKSIKETLESLIDQDTDLDYEVVLIDNNSTDKTVEIAKPFQKRINLRVINEKKQGRGAARARGFEEAKGRIILSADADSIFYKDWINTLVKPLNGKVVAATTSCKIVDCTPLTNAVFNLLQPKIVKAYRIFFGYYWLSGFSFSILKEAYKKSGGFDKDMQSQEDTDLSFKVAKVGKIAFIDKPVIFSGRRFKDGLLVGLYDYLRSFTEAFLFRNKKVYLSNIR